MIGWLILEPKQEIVNEAINSLPNMQAIVLKQLLIGFKLKLMDDELKKKACHSTTWGVTATSSSLQQFIWARIKSNTMPMYKGHKRFLPSNRRMSDALHYQKHEV